MKITPRSAATPNQPLTTDPLPPGTGVATVNFRLGNWTLSTAGVLGEVSGYASVDAALTAARTLTSGEALPAAGAFEINGRYFLRALDAEYYIWMQPKQRDPKTPFTWLEHLALSPFPELWKEARFDRDGSGARFPRHAALRAVIDGPALLTAPSGQIRSIWSRSSS